MAGFPSNQFQETPPSETSNTDAPATTPPPVMPVPSIDSSDSPLGQATPEINSGDTQQNENSIFPVTPQNKVQTSPETSGTNSADSGGTTGAPPSAPSTGPLSGGNPPPVTPPADPTSPLPNGNLDSGTYQAVINLEGVDSNNSFPNPGTANFHLNISSSIRLDRAVLGVSITNPLEYNGYGGGGVMETSQAGNVTLFATTWNGYRNGTDLPG